MLCFGTCSGLAFRPGVLYILDNQVWLSIRQRPELSKFCSKLEGRALCTLQRTELNLPPLPEDEGPALWPSITEPLNPLELVEFFGIGLEQRRPDRSVVSRIPVGVIVSFAILLSRHKPAHQYFPIRCARRTDGPPFQPTVAAR